MNYTMTNEGAQAARKAEQRSQWIDAHGAYKGTFTLAESIEASTGTAGIAFVFESDDGRKCNLNLYTVKKDGTQLIGYQQVMALMACLGIRDIKVEDRNVPKWDRDSNSEIVSQLPVYPAIMRKPIGVFLETRDYKKRDGTVGKGVEIAGFFRASDMMVASEILDRAKAPEQFERIVDSLRHKPLQRSQGAQQSTQQSENPAPRGAGYDYMDDDIPF